MHRYRAKGLGALCAAIVLPIAGCSVPTSKENVAATAQLVAPQTQAPLLWRRDEAAEKQARASVEAMLADGLTVEEAAAVAFLASPELQLSLEQLEISRSQLVAASTAPNPVAVIGSRQPGGNFASFYPGNTLTLGVMQGVLGLLQIPERRAVASRDLDRARYQAAQECARLAAQVVQAWFDYSAALQLEQLRNRSLAVVQTALDTLRQQEQPATPTPDESASRVLNLARQGNELFKTQNTLQRSSTEVATSRERLGQMLGLAGWHDDWKIAGGLPPLPPTDADAAALEEAAVGKRLDVKAAERAVDARLKNLALTRHFRWLNQLDIGMFRDIVSGGTQFTGPNAVVELPLFDQRQAQLLEADAQLRTAVRTLESVRLNARAEIRINAAEMHGARLSLERYEQSGMPNFRQMELALGNPRDPGSSDRLEVQIAVLEAEEDRVTTLRDYWRARSALALSLADWPSAQLSR
jgi:cobalt-zinc-cadmium efflux system outer membrane protein